jgi:hypothetical protein
MLEYLGTEEDVVIVMFGNVENVADEIMVAIIPAIVLKPWTLWIWNVLVEIL